MKKYLKKFLGKYYYGFDIAFGLIVGPSIIIFSIFCFITGFINIIS